MERNLWAEIGNACLLKAIAMLKDETAPAEATVGTVKELIDIAISIDMLNLRWEAQSRYGAAAFPDRTSRS